MRKARGQNTVKERLHELWSLPVPVELQIQVGIFEDQGWDQQQSRLQAEETHHLCLSRKGYTCCQGRSVQKIQNGIKHNIYPTNTHLTFKVDVCAHAHPPVVCLWTGLLLYILFRCGHWYQNSLWFRRPKNRSWIQQEAKAWNHWNL